MIKLLPQDRQLNMETDARMECTMQEDKRNSAAAGPAIMQRSCCTGSGSCGAIIGSGYHPADDRLGEMAWCEGNTEFDNHTKSDEEDWSCRQEDSQRRWWFQFHLGMIPSVLLLFLFLTLSAQQCSAEVVRLRHPEHLYYGDGPPYSNLHRHSKNIILMTTNPDFLMGDGTVAADRGSSAGGITTSSQDEGGGEAGLLTMNTEHQSSTPHHNSAFSGHYSKRKSHNNNNNNINSNNNFKNISGGSSSSSSSSDSSVSRGASSSTYSNYEHPPPQLRGLHHSESFQQPSLPAVGLETETTSGNAPAFEDVELPVYFARQGNDGGQEAELPQPTQTGTSSEEAAAANNADKSQTTHATPVEEEGGKLFPPDLFTKKQRQQGAVIFYIIGVIYMFVALAIVCDEFFVPSLDVIIEFLGIQDDVAGATFMAAGGSAPELFTSVIGVFISKDDVGIGTIVGSAVFNILFVIGMCALFSKTVLQLTWWPLFRDCSFYSIALITLIVFFRDSYIYWWEAAILFGIYGCYVTFMKFNQTVERGLKKLLFKNRVTRVSSTDQLVNNKSVNNGASSSQTSVQTVSGNQSSRGSATLKPPLSAQGRRNSIPMLHSGSKFRHGLLQLMIQSIDPLHDGRVDEKATQLHAIASLKALLDAAKTEADQTVTNNSRSKPVSPPQVPASVQPSDTPLTAVDIEDQANGDAPTVQELAALQEAEVEGHEPLDISWPKGDCKKQISYVVLFPIMICLYMTLPDTRTPRGKKFFYWGFLGSILWIAVFSYFMVWWADKTGDTFGIAPEIMGLTFLAAGTSIPDLITSVIVARKGLGDMAVSSSVGSNIFDVCVGLPVPWLLYGIFKGEPVEVSAKGMLCSISILFGMLCFVVLSIMAFRWKMNKGLGLVMFVLYFIFLGVSLLFEYDVITCPKFFDSQSESSE